MINNPPPEIKQLYKFVAQRDLIAEFIWLLLARKFYNQSPIK